jgi:16S rRNA (guanine527-N7)-methyltransferase
MSDITQSEREQFAGLIQNVSRETFSALDAYAGLLTEWNARFNLVAESSIPHIWQRHFLDSAQLWPLIPDSAGSLADIGSGAGFPGLVLAILAKGQGRRLAIHLIESTGKKANFLREISQKLALDVTVHNARAEDLKLKPDVITARAVAPLGELLKYAKPLIHKDSLCLFLKGKSARDELTESKKYWTFACETKPSLSDSSGTVLIVRDIRHKNAAPHKRRR